MKKFFLFFVSFILLNFAPYFTVKSKIISSQNISDISEYIEVGTLVVFDIDNTLITPKKNVCSDQWFYNAVQKIAKNKNISQEQAIKLMIQLTTKLQPLIEAHKVEESTSTVIQNIQEKGYATIAITARDRSMKHATIQQLAHVNINLEKTSPLKGYFDIQNIGSFEKGVLFLNQGVNKGMALVYLLNSMGNKPSKIIFIDDNKTYVNQVDQFMEAIGMPSVCLHYQADIKAFDKLNAKLELLDFIKNNDLEDTLQIAFATCAPTQPSSPTCQSPSSSNQKKVRRNKSFASFQFNQQ